MDVRVFDTPASLTGTSFEEGVVLQNERYKTKKVADVSRYGVKAARMKDGWVIHSSYPDFEGVVIGGRQIIFDCKACSSSSFSWGPYREDGSRKLQLTHMLDRSQYGVPCAFLFHWNQRELETKTVAQHTVWFPVDAKNEYWDKVWLGEIKSLKLEECLAWGMEVKWVAFGRERLPGPDYLSAVPF